jgi:hypothetical protein
VSHEVAGYYTLFGEAEEKPGKLMQSFCIKYIIKQPVRCLVETGKKNIFLIFLDFIFNIVILQVKSSFN